MADRLLEEGEPVLLRRKEGESWVLRLRRGGQRIEGEGVIDLTEQIGRAPGASIDWAGRRFVVLRPTLPDLLGSLRRRAQIVTPKDALYLLYLAGVGPGATVLEAGSGSGALTLVLAHAVGPTGRVVSYDRRADFLAVARGNVEMSGLEARVEFRERDVVAAGFDAADEADSVVLDLPTPWDVLDAADRALRPGGRLASYSPTYNQVERTVGALRRLKFEELRTVELLERSLHVGEGGTRPDFDMLGHTGFLTGGRKIGSTPW